MIGVSKDFSRADHLQDCAYANDYLADQSESAKEISLVGANFGGYLVCLLTSVRQV